MTIAQIVYDNELHFGYSHEEIHEKVPSFFSLSSAYFHLPPSARLPLTDGVLSVSKLLDNTLMPPLPLFGC